MAKIVGIDTGAKGCAFMIDSETHQYIDHFRFEATELGLRECGGGKGWYKCNLVSVNDIRAGLESLNPDWIVIEQVSGGEGKNTKATLLSQGYNYHCALLAASMILPSERIRLAHSLDWKRSLKLTSRKGVSAADKKKKTLEFVEQKFPSDIAKSIFYGPKGGIIDGVSDAAAIAIYGYQYLKRNQLL